MESRDWVKGKAGLCRSLGGEGEECGRSPVAIRGTEELR
jgi:hypothetical protein